MNIELVRLTPEYKTQLIDMLTEWKADIEKNHTNHSPWMIFKNDFNDFDYYLENLEIKEETEDGWVPDTTLFCLDKDRNIFVGAVNIRHYLNEGLLRTGGHIGDGIRPSERRKGYATAMIALALEECKKLGIDKVLMCCDKDNVGSAKSIINNGGILENEVRIDLLFYHRGLQCLVAIELKVGKFKPEYVSKLDFYLEALDRQVKKENENPSVGLLLCATKNDEVVEYSMSRTMSPMMVAEYKLQLPDKEVLQKKLQELINIPLIEE